MGMTGAQTVIDKLAALKAYSTAQDPLTAALFAPVEAAVATYFSSNAAGLSAALEDVVKYMYNDISRRTTVYEFEFDMYLANDFPTGYNDITECFYQFEELLAVSESSFFNAFVYGAPDGAAGEGTTGAPLSNPYLDRWVAEITAALDSDLANVKALAEWCKNSGGCCDLVCLFENRGRTLESKTVKEIAAMIYHDKKLKEVIIARQLIVYLPSYFRG